MARAGIRGMLLGLCNTIVVALCMAMMEPPNGHSIGHIGQRLDIFVLVVIIGGMFGLITGYGLGVLVGALTVRRVPRAIILVVSSALACGVVAWLGRVNELSELTLYACVPTIVGCSVLERWTRPRDQPPVPPAVVC